MGFAHERLPSGSKPTSSTQRSASILPRANLSELTQLAADLVAIDSVNPALVPGAAGEHAIAEFAVRWCRAAGLEAEVVGDERPSVIATKRGSGGGRSLLLNGHLDTVSAERIDARIENGRLYGRGAYDMKGALAALMLATKEADGLAGDVILTLVADEELGSVGTEAVLERVTADAAIVAEPTDLEVAVAHRGFVAFEIETTGVAAHGSRSDLGVDAIAKMGPTLVALQEHHGRLVAGRSHPLVGTGSIHASIIEGGQELSSYPARCVLLGERRTLPGETRAHVEAELRELAGDALVRVGLSRDPYEAELGHPFLDLFEGERVGALFWTDAALFAGAGIPTVLYGPKGAGAHADEEWVDLASLEKIHTEVLRIARAWCGSSS